MKSLIREDIHVTVVFTPRNEEEADAIRTACLELKAVRIETGDGLKQRDELARRCRKQDEFIRDSLEGLLQ